MKQVRQTVTFWNKERKEYRVKLFLDGIYQKKADYFTNDLQDAVETAVAMRENPKKVIQIQDDFCKKATKRSEKQNPVKRTVTDWPIYNTDTSELTGWLSIEENEALPEWLEVNGMFYQKKGKINILAG